MAFNSYLGLVLEGLAANRPTTPESPSPGSPYPVRYFATDTGVMSVYSPGLASWIVEATMPLPTMLSGVTASTTHTIAGGTKVAGGYVNIATCANAGDAVVLPANPVVGQEVFISNAGAAAAGVYPGASTDKIDGGSAGAAATLTNVKSALFTCVAVGPANWQSVGFATRSA
jgi:hypothetical protein